VAGGYRESGGRFEILSGSMPFRRPYKRGKSGSEGGIGRTFSVRLNFLLRSPSSWCSRTVIWPPPRCFVAAPISSGVRSTTVFVDTAPLAATVMPIAAAVMLSEISTVTYASVFANEE
jgi:hypothetical protein